MNTDNLDTLNDAQLSEVFAVEVAGWKRTVEPWDNGWEIVQQVRFRAAGEHDRKGYWSELPVNYAASADAVLPFLEKRDTLLDYAVNKIEPRGAWVISVYHSEGHADGEADTFARAACIALIRAKRAEKEAAS